MKNEKLYIAGPMCFYQGGYPRWYAMRDCAKIKGFEVTMPNDTNLDLSHRDLQKNGDAIFANCVKCMDAATAILCNLEFYRGADVDGGSIYEVGMAFAKGAHCYGYTRDKRSMAWKYQGSTLRGSTAYDRKGRPLPYSDLPFSSNVVGSMKIIEGDFDDCLKVFCLDREEERKRSSFPTALERQADVVRPPDGQGPIVYLAGPERYSADAQALYEDMKAFSSQLGFCALVPTDEVRELPEKLMDDPYARAYHIFHRQQQHVRDCDILIANLNDFHGWEPDSDTAFECGMAFQLGKRLYGYMDSTSRMIDRIPNLGPEKEYRDLCGCNVENFDYPINIMFASSMTIVQGTFADALTKAAQDMKANPVYG